MCRCPAVKARMLHHFLARSHKQIGTSQWKCPLYANCLLTYNSGRERETENLARVLKGMKEIESFYTDFSIEIRTSETANPPPPNLSEFVLYWLIPPSLLTLDVLSA